MSSTFTSVPWKKTPIKTISNDNNNNINNNNDNANNNDDDDDDDTNDKDNDNGNKCLATDMNKMILYSLANKTHFYKKRFTLSFVLKMRVFGIRKWPIKRRGLNFV